MIRRRVEHYETKTGHERWLVSYSDFITLLFGFFVVMYSVSHVNENKYRTLSETLSSAFEGKVAVDKDDQRLEQNYPQDNKGSISGLSPSVNLIDTDILVRELEQSLLHLVDQNQVRLQASEEWVEIDVDANLLFQSGSADASLEAQEIFKKVGQLLAPYDNAIEVAGHTDDQPIASAQFKSNWELSTARASSIVRLLATNGVAPMRMAAVGYGEFRPIADNNSETGRAQNRRVALIVARTPVERQIVAADQWQEGKSKAQAGESTSTDLSSPEQLLLRPTETSEELNPASSNTPDASVEPVRTQSGGLLFTSDPPAE